MKKIEENGAKATQGVVLSSYITPANPIPTPVSADFAIVIPRINVNAPIFDVDGSDQSEYLPTILTGIGHYIHKNLPQVVVDGAYPGEPGNIFLFGHSQIPGGDRSHFRGIFNDLGDLGEGDLVVVYFKNQEYRYLVTKTELIDRANLKYLEKTPVETLTLMTCWPLGLDIKRYIVQAQRVV